MKTITALSIAVFLVGCSATQTKPEPVGPIELENTEHTESVDVQGHKVTITIVIE